MNAYIFLKITFWCCLFYLMLIFSNTMEIEYKYKLKILNPSRVGFITIPYTDHPLNVNSTLFYLELPTVQSSPCTQQNRLRASQGRRSNSAREQQNEIFGVWQFIFRSRSPRKWQLLVLLVEKKISAARQRATSVTAGSSQQQQKNV